jgi:tripartite-type tricarboxylate transporter receptor subunit TctC
MSVRGRGMVTAKRRATVLALAAVISCSVMAYALPAGAANAPAKKQTPLEQGLAFYKGQTISLISPTAPGGPLDLWARAVATYLGIYLHATVEVQNLPGGNTYPGQDTAAASAPTGLTLAQLNLPTDLVSVIENQPALNFNPEREAFVSAEASTANVLVDQVTPNCSEYDSLAALRTATTPASFLIQTTGTPTESVQAWMGLIGANVKYIPGYTTAAALVNGFARGDGCLAFLNGTQVGSLVQAGKAKPIAISFKLPPGTEYRNILDDVPTLASSVKQYAKTTKLAQAQAEALVTFEQVPAVLALQSKAPAADVDAIRAATEWAFKQSGFKSLLLQDSASTQYIDAETAKQLYITSLRETPKIVCLFNLNCPTS